MKKTIYIFIATVLLPLFSLGQNELDALRYSQNYFGGTARSMSMGGAFGALGGDVSTLSYNPAGVAMFRSTELTFSPSLFFNETNSDFFVGNQTQQTSTDSKYNFNFNNLGIVVSYVSENESDWKSVNFAVGYNRKNNFNQNIIIEGNNTNSSLLDNFWNTANGQSPESLWAYRERLAFDTYLIDTLPGSNNQYVIPLAQSANLTQRKTIQTAGGMGEYVFSFGANYNHKLYLGATFGVQSIHFDQTAIHREFNNELDANYYDMESFSYRETLTTSGTGFNVKIGAIYRPTDWLRIGGAVHTPTFVSLTDEYYTEMQSSVHLGSNPATGYETFRSEPTDDQGYDLGVLFSEYEVTTPFRAMGSIGMVIQKRALISIDYEYLDYSKIKLRSDEYDFYDENNTIKNTFGSTFNLRAGAEIRLADAYTLRGGYAYYGSPYQTATNREDGASHWLSGGFGIRSANFYFDFAYVYEMTNTTHYLYDVPEPFEVVGADTEARKSRIITTFGIRF